MTLKDWQNNGWLKPHKATRKQIADLFAIVERDLVAAQTEDLTADWKFGIAYNAALKLCTILLYAEGYRPENQLAHFRAIAALPLVLGPARKADADYLEACRVKRNKVEYDTIDQATPEQAAELVKFVVELREEVVAFLNTNKRFSNFVL
jgi:hypothetical protein